MSQMKTYFTGSRPGVIFLGLLISWNLPSFGMDRSTRNKLEAPEIGLSLGELMIPIPFDLADPKLPRAATSVDDSNVFPLDPDTIVVQFPQAQFSKKGEPWRVILTEHGIWAAERQRPAHS